MKTIKCFDRITRVTEYLAFQSQAHELNMACKPTCLDCTIMYGVHRETEKAWCFDLGEDWPRWGSRRYVRAPKSACRELVQDYWDGERDILVPAWVSRKW